MFPDSMEDLEIAIAVRRQVENCTLAETHPGMDPSLYAPWGIRNYEQHTPVACWKRADGSSSRPD